MTDEEIRKEMLRNAQIADFEMVQLIMARAAQAAHQHLPEGWGMFMLVFPRHTRDKHPGNPIRANMKLRETMDDFEKRIPLDGVILDSNRSE